MLNAANGDTTIHHYLPYGLSVVVVVVVALFICVITLGTGLAYMHRHRDGDRSLGKHRNMTSSSSTYALAPVYCADSQQTSSTTADAGGLTVLPQSPSRARTLPLRMTSPSPRTRRRLQTMGQCKMVMDDGVDVVTTPIFNDLDVWKTSHDHDDLSVLPAHSVWSDTEPLPPPPLTTTTWQRCSCTAGPPPCMTTPGSGRARRPVPPPPSPTIATTSSSFSTFKPSPVTSPAGVVTRPITLRPDRCGDAGQTKTRPQHSCHAMSLHLHVKRGVQNPDNSNRSEQSPA